MHFQPVAPQRGSSLSSPIPSDTKNYSDVAKNPGQYSREIRAAAASHFMMHSDSSKEELTYAAGYIMGHEGHSVTERVSATRYIRQHPESYSDKQHAYAEQQVMEHPENFTGEELESSLKFIIHHPKNFTPEVFHDAAQKMIKHHDEYTELVSKGLLSEVAPHFNKEDLQQAAQLFIIGNSSFFTASPEDVKQFLLFSKIAKDVDQSGIVNDYRDALFQLLCTSGIEEHAGFMANREIC